MLSYQFLGIGDKKNDDVLLLNQIHSDKILILGKNSSIPQSNKIEADAIITNQKNLKIGIKTADCVPILLFSNVDNNSVCAAIHAGWRGAKKDIIKNVVIQMQKLGAESKNIEAFIGPCIRQKSYQVSLEFYQDFLGDNPDFTKFFIKCPEQVDHFLFDLPEFVKEKLQKEKVTKITDCLINTYQSDDFFSYRAFSHKIKAKNGRNLSYINI